MQGKPGAHGRGGIAGGALEAHWRPGRIPRRAVGTLAISRIAPIGWAMFFRLTSVHQTAASETTRAAEIASYARLPIIRFTASRAPMGARVAVWQGHSMTCSPAVHMSAGCQFR